MKKIIALVVLGAMLMGPATAFAASTPQSAGASAGVNEVLTLAMVIKEETGTDANGNPTFGAAVTSMDHATLIRDGDNALRGKAFHVWLGPNTSSRQYNITATMAEFQTSAGVKLPHSVGIVPVSATRPGVTGNIGTLAAKRDAVGTGYKLYDSDAAGRSVTLENVVFYSGGNADGTLPFTGWQATPPDQAKGTYATTHTFTLTTV